MLLPSLRPLISAAPHLTERSAWPTAADVVEADAAKILVEQVMAVQNLRADKIARPEPDLGGCDPIRLRQLQRVVVVSEAMVAVLAVTSAAGIQRAEPDQLVRVDVDV